MKTNYIQIRADDQLIEKIDKLVDHYGINRTAVLTMLIKREADKIAELDNVKTARAKAIDSYIMLVYETIMGWSNDKIAFARDHIGMYINDWSEDYGLQLSATEFEYIERELRDMLSKE